MITPEERDKNILAHILEYCRHIDECLLTFGNSYEVFLSDVLFRNAVSMAEFRIGSLSESLSDGFREKNTDNIQLKKICGMSDSFAHDYLNMDIETIWKVAAEDIPVLRKFCEAQLKGSEYDVD